MADARTDDGAIYYNVEEMEHRAEEYEAAMLWLDNQQVPFADGQGQTYSLVGRIILYGRRMMER